MTSPRPSVPKSLDEIHVESPCTQSWDAMTGDDRSRYCGECRLHVHDLSTMTRAEAETFVLAEKGAGRSLCVRFVRRPDGTVATRDDVPAPRALPSARTGWRAAAAAALALLFPLAACRQTTMGGLRTHPQTPAAVPEDYEERQTLGNLCDPAPPAPQKAPEPPVPPTPPPPPAPASAEPAPGPNPPPPPAPPPEPPRRETTGKI